jgi:hypothetical protein
MCKRVRADGWSGSGCLPPPSFLAGEISPVVLVTLAGVPGEFGLVPFPLHRTVVVRMGDNRIWRLLSYGTMSPKMSHELAPCDVAQ